MFGYLKEYAPELKVREHVLYRAVYCGVCRALGRCGGFCSRAALQYDAVLFALVRALLAETAFEAAPSRCFLHPLRKHPIVKSNPVLDETAAVSLLLTEQAAADAAEDAKGVKKMLVRPVFRLCRRFAGHAKKPALRETLTEKRQALTVLEKQACTSLDTLASADGALIGSAFADGLPEKSSRLVYEIGETLGKWLYIIDALDDYKRDKAQKAFNPFILLYPDGVPREALHALRYELIRLLAELERLLDLLPQDTGENPLKPLIDNIVRESMRRTTERVTTVPTQKGAEQ